MPLFDSLRWDTIWVVRHSALFALPSILGRLSPAQRRTVALETVVALSADKHATVRCGVLESLGEVLYTFVNDDSGPPDQLIQLFLGRQEDKVIRTGQKESFTTLQSVFNSLNLKVQNLLEPFYTQEKRPLICAFNFPAVALTLGGDKWAMLRENYFDLVKNPNVNVSRTLAASLGEIAKIIGAEKARRDLVDVWRGFLRSGEVDVRMKAVESLLDLMKVVLGEEKKIGDGMVGAVRKAWQEDLFNTWRERECVMKRLMSWFTLIWSTGRARVHMETVGIFRDLLVKGLEDAAANVREAAIANVSFGCFCPETPFLINSLLGSGHLGSLLE
jgi:serine/threonine-protein phosphatase 4 regulatory subunit 1